MRNIGLVILLLLAGCGRTPESEPRSAEYSPVQAEQDQPNIVEDSGKQKPKHEWRPAWPDPEAVAALYREFGGFLRTSDAYEKRIRRDATGYPEGAIFALALPAYGFANYALAHPEAAAECRRNIERLIEIDCRTGKPLVGARGCDLSGTFCFLGHLAPEHCRDLYARYKKTFWIERGAGGFTLCGFREWPPGTDGAVDIDSGPILFDIGAAASGFGLGATRFAADAAGHRELLATLDHMRLTADTAEPLLQGLIGGLIVSKDYRYRHLMADAVAFYCLTWRPWCDPL